MKKIYSFLIASLFSAMLVSAAPTKGLQFTGATDSYINCGQDAAYTPTQFTIETWAYYESTSGGYIMSNEGHNGTIGAHGFSLRTSGSKVELALGANANWPSLASATNIPLNTWIHVAVTYSGTEMKIYINGVEDASTTITTPMVASSENLSIGEGSMWKDRRFTGKMGDLRFWNVVRTQAQIAASMSTALTGTETGLIANWKMNEGTGNTVADATGSHNLTKTDAVTWFGTNTSVSNTLAGKIKATIAEGSLRVKNNFDSKINVYLYNVSGQKVIEKTIDAGNSFEQQLNTPTGVFVLKCVAEDGTVYSEKFNVK